MYIWNVTVPTGTTSGEKDTYAKIQIHYNTCGRKEIPCPNVECSSCRPRDEMEAHVQTECPYSMIPCKFQSIGCETEMMRKDMAVHEEDDKLHLNLALNAVVRNVAVVEKLQTELKDTRANSDVAVERLQKELESAKDMMVPLEGTAPQKNWRTFVLTGYQEKKRTSFSLHSTLTPMATIWHWR